MYLAEALKKTVGVNEYAPSRLSVQMKVNNLRTRIERGERATIPKEEPYENRITQYLTEEELKKKINQGAAAYKKGVQDEYDKLKLSVYDNTPEGQELYLQEARKQAEFQKLISDPDKIQHLLRTDPAGLKAMMSEAELNRQLLDAKKQQHKLHELARGNTKAAQADANKDDEDAEEEAEEAEEAEKAEEERIEKVKDYYNDIKVERTDRELKKAELQQLIDDGADQADKDAKQDEIDNANEKIKEIRKELKKIAKESEIEAIDDLNVYYKLKDISVTQSGRAIINNRTVTASELKKYMKQLGFDYSDKDTVPKLVEKYNNQKQNLKDTVADHYDIDPDAKMAEEWAKQWKLDHPDMTEAEARQKGYQVIDIAKRMANNPAAIVGNRYVYDDNVRPLTLRQQQRAQEELKKTMKTEKEKEAERKVIADNTRKAREAKRLKKIQQEFDEFTDIPEAATVRVRNKAGVIRNVDGMMFTQPNGLKTFVAFTVQDGVKPTDKILDNTGNIDNNIDSTDFQSYIDDYLSDKSFNVPAIPQNVQRAQKINLIRRAYTDASARKNVELSPLLAPTPTPIVNTQRMTEFGHGFKPLHKFPKDVIQKSIHAAMNTPSFRNIDQHQYNREQAHHLTQMARIHQLHGEGFFSDLRDKIGNWLFWNVHPAGRMIGYAKDKLNNK
jgi:hypothetical protein